MTSGGSDPGDDDDLDEGAEDDLDDGTLIVRRGPDPAGAGPDGGEELDDATRLSPRTGTATGTGSAQELRRSAPDIDADTGSTVVVRRESRRRAEAAAREAEEDADLDHTVVGAGVRPLAATTAGDMPAPLGRRAHTPSAEYADFGVQGPRVVIATRSAPPVHVPQEPIDGAATEAAVRRLARRRAATVVAGASSVLILAVAAMCVLVFAF